MTHEIIWFLAGVGAGTIIYWMVRVYSRLRMLNQLRKWRHG